MNRPASLTILSLVATPWAAAMTLAGLWLLASAGRGDSGLSPVTRFVLGITALAAGQLVFMCLVADRLFPEANRRVVWWLEVFTCVVLFGGVAWLGALAL